MVTEAKVRQNKSLSQNISFLSETKVFSSRIEDSAINVAEANPLVARELSKAYRIW